MLAVETLVKTSIIIGLAEDMCKDGYPNITNIDFSPTVIGNMKELHKEDEFAILKCNGYLILDDIMDVRDLKFPPGSFDIVIDKATLDAILVYHFQL